MHSDAFTTAAKHPSSDDQELEVLGQSSAAPHGSLGVKPSAQIRHTNLIGDKHLSGVTPVDTNQAHQPDGLHGSSLKQNQTKTQKQGSSLNRMLPKFSGGNPSQNSADASGDVRNAPQNAESTPEKATNLVLCEALDQPSPFATNGLSEILNQTKCSESMIRVEVVLAGATDVIIEESLPKIVELLKEIRSGDFGESLQNRLEPALENFLSLDEWTYPIVNGKQLKIPSRAIGSVEFYSSSTKLQNNLENFAKSVMSRMRTSGVNAKKFKDWLRAQVSLVIIEIIQEHVAWSADQTALPTVANSSKPIEEMVEVQQKSKIVDTHDVEEADNDMTVADYSLYPIGTLKYQEYCKEIHSGAERKGGLVNLILPELKLAFDDTTPRWAYIKTMSWLQHLHKHGKSAIMDSSYTLTDIIEFTVYWY